MDYREVVLREHREKRARKRRRQKLIKTLLLLAVITILSFAIFKGLGYVSSVAPELIAPPTPVPTAVPTPTPTPTPAPTATPSPRRGSAQAIPEDVRQIMRGKSMPSGASVSFDDLSYLTIPHYDFNYNVVEGHLIVNKALAEEVLDIFAELYDIKYPIERMEIVDKYGADDYESIEYNNTSAFNYRVSTDGSGRLSKHALGRAIDINPQINPYVNSNGTGAHPNAREYWSRDTSKWTSEVAKAAYIGKDSEIYRIFVNKYGWEWGGAWSSYRDYQHFQKFN